MDNSDDYFDDSLVLDEDDLKSLEMAEEKFFASQQPKPPPPEPPFKKQKTTHNWTTALSQKPPAATTTDIDDIPVIFAREDGSYGLRGRGHVVPGLFKSGRGVESVRGGGRGRGLNVSGAPGSTLRKGITQDRQTASGAYAPLASAMMDVQQAQTLTQMPDMPLRFQTPVMPSRDNVYLETMQFPSFKPVSVALQDGSLKNVDDEPDSHLQKQLEDLRTQLAKLSEENAIAQQSLKEAQEIRYAKEGEVSILRKGMEKITQEHAADVSKLKAAKEESEAMRIKLQREMKEEVERLRTQFIFKQHEAETSTRKPPWSVRSKKAMQGFPPTPVPIPPAMRSWGSRINPPSQAALKRTPTRPLRVSGSQIKTPQREGMKIEQPVFRGFENSFMQSSPVKSPTKRKEQKAFPGNILESNETMDSFVFAGGKSKGKLPSTFGIGSQVAGFPTQKRRSPRRLPEPDTFADVDMHDGSPSRKSLAGSSPGVDIADMSMGADTEIMDEADPESPEGYEPFEGIDWSDEFKRLILTHVTDSSSTLTLHVLLSVSLPSTIPQTTVDKYQTACASVLETIAVAKFSTDSMTIIASSLITIMHLMIEAENLEPLTAVISLFASLSLFIPGFTAALLKVESSLNSGKVSALCMLVCDVVRDLLSPSRDGKSTMSDTTELARATMDLLEAICWSVPDDYTDKLTTIIRRDRVFSTLLDEKQPPASIGRTLRLLVLFASHSSLFRSLLSYPIPDGQVDPPARQDYSRLPLIERMCTFLVDPTPLDNQAGCVSSIIHFIALLCLAHSDALVILSESLTLVPSLLYYLNQQTTLIWEDDETVMDSVEVSTTTVRAINRTLQLLHRMVFTPSPTLNLRHKLYYAQRQFNGLNHMFVVTMGRLSYADAPIWLSEELKAEIEQLAEPTRDLLELIVEGPEGDSIWEAYQGGDEEEQGVPMEEDEEEIQARQMDANDI